MRDTDPWGLILFKRNVETPDQVRALVDSFRQIVGRDDAPVLIDQEGGRVQRLGPPHWPAYPAGGLFGKLHALDANAGLTAARLGARLIAEDLAALGITVDCLPVADVPQAGSTQAIGNRAYGEDAATVAAIAGAVAEGLMEGGVLPVVKHMPGHGRAVVDSHEKLPVVEADRATLSATDFAAFKPLNNLPLGMTGHIVFTDIDPDAPATQSKTVIDDVIRREIGFTGALMTDDLSMKALAGDFAERTRASLAAGCDLALHCNGDMAEMIAVASAAPILAGEALRRTELALDARKGPGTIDVAEARARFSAMIG
ncbi:beta-N-acetylhexosaminidase [Variibacter gotjawalensis]|nr:beta-N-acetylhexosaminidase [Variibacter gotjawalensis]